VHDHASFDFSRLEPQWLAVALFVALPALSGAVTATLAEHWITEVDRTRAWPRWRLVLGAAGAVLTLPILAFSPLVAGAAVAAVVLAVLAARVPAVAVVWRGRAVTVAGTAVLVGLVAWGVYGLAADIVSIATDVPSTAPLSP
jgi:hypothetical protein